MTDSPSFICKFSDGQSTRMTVYHEGKKFDVIRGVALACHAYRSRTQKKPPEIIEAQFVDAASGKVLAQYSATEIIAELAQVAP
jgi:hypothetical protein